MGAMFGAADEIAFDDPRLDDFATALARDKPALVLPVQCVTPTDLVTAVGPFGAKTSDIEPGSTWENGYCESFNARFSIAA